MKLIHFLSVPLILAAPKIWAGWIDENGDYRLTDRELEAIYQEAVNDIETYDDKKTVDDYLEDGNQQESLKFDFELGVISSSYTIGGVTKSGAGAYGDFLFFRNDRSDFFMHVERVNYSADNSIPALTVNHFAAGVNIRLFWTVKAVVMVGLAKVTRTDPSSTVYKAKSAPPVADFGLSWSQPDANPSFGIKLIKRQYKLTQELSLPGSDKTTKSVHDTSALNYIVGVRFTF